MKKKDQSTIQALDRGLQLLHYIGAHPQRRMGLQELARHMEMDPSTVYRMLNTLIKNGLVRQEEESRTYLLGHSLLTLGGASRRQSKLTAFSTGILRDIVRETGETAHLVVRSGHLAVFIDTESASETIAIHHEIGFTAELYCTAVGKCLLSQWESPELESFYKGTKFTAHTPRTITSLKALSAELKKVARQGYALDDEEREPGVFCVAAPVLNHLGRVEAALGISGPHPRLAPRQSALIKALTHQAEELSRLLGHSV